jgi:hypothetical protein
MTHAPVESRDWETAEDLLAAAMAAGHTVTRHQLRRWQQAGALPAPAQHGLGRSQGTEVRYPVGASGQLLALLTQLAKDRSIERARWALWWAGFSVPATYIRATLSAALAELEEKERYVALMDSDAPEGDAAAEALERWAGSRQVGPFRHYRARTRGKFPTFVRFMVDVATGRFDGWSAEVAIAVSKSLAIPTSGTPTEDNPIMNEGDFRAVSGVLRPSSLRACYESATWQDVEAARDELRVALPVFAALFQSAASAGEPGFAAHAELVNEKELRESMPLLLLAWLSARRIDGVRQAYDQLAGVIRALGTGLRLRVTDQGVEVENG